MATKCMIPDEIHGVHMSHSDDVMEVWHGLDTPAGTLRIERTRVAS